MNSKEKQIITIICIAAAGTIALTLGITATNNMNDAFTRAYTGQPSTEDIRQMCAEQTTEIIGEANKLSETICVGLVLEELNK
jgi:hypothetical protein